MALALIALGSNVGDAAAHLRSAVDLLSQEVRVVSVSAVYETEPMYVLDQPKFMNAALSAETELGPSRLLAVLKRIEQEVGRQARDRYGPREVDLDLIAYGSLIYSGPGLEVSRVSEMSAPARLRRSATLPLMVPHPRTPERRFVLAPLNDVATNFVLPGLGKVSELLEATKQQSASVQRREDVALSLHGVR